MRKQFKGYPGKTYQNSKCQILNNSDNTSLHRTNFSTLKYDEKISLLYLPRVENIDIFSSLVSIFDLNKTINKIIFSTLHVENPWQNNPF